MTKDAHSSISLLRYTLLSVLIAECLTLAFSFAVSLAVYGGLVARPFIMGAVYAFVVPIAASPLLVRWFYRRSEGRENALSESGKFLGMIFESIHDPVVIIDRDFRIARANEEYARIKGKNVGELTGRLCYEALLGSTSRCEGCIIEKTFNSKDPCAKEKISGLPDGTEAWLQLYTYPIFNELGDVTHVIEYTRDITERKRTEEENRKLIEELEHFSTTDVLTGLVNRRAIMVLVERELRRAVRYDNELSLMLCDIDKFKDVNDNYGHEAGDRSLIAVAEALRMKLRYYDIAARYGGDEFLILLPQTGLDGARDLAERIRAGIEGHIFNIYDDLNLKLTISIGVTCLARNDPDENINTIIKRTDNALYAAKRGGRNRVYVLE